MKILHLILTSILLFASNQSWSAALPQEKGKFFLAPEWSYYKTDHFWDKKSHTKPLSAPFIKRELSLYGEYGLTDKTTLTGRVAYNWLSSGPNNSGLAALDFGAIHNLLRKGPIAFSLYGTAVLPAGNGPKDSGNRPYLSYNRFAVEGGVLFGSYGKNAFFDSGIGYRIYSGYPSNQIRFYLTSGVNTSEKIQLLGSVYGTIGTGSSAILPTTQSVNITSPAYYQLIQVSAGVRYHIKPGVSIVPQITIPVWGVETGKGYTAGISLWTQF